MPIPPQQKPRSTIFLGLDPGVQGGIVALLTDGSAVLDVELNANEHLTPHEMWHLISGYRPSIHTGVFAILEKVGGFAGNWASGGNGPAMFTFGHSAGMMEMALIAAGIPYAKETPQAWLKHYSMKKDKGEGDTSWKNRLKARAQQLFPTARITKAVSDALLMAEFGRRTERGA